MLKQKQFRKNSDYSESEEEQTIMFPKISEKQIQASLQVLQENYKKKQHAYELANYCFRCHNSQFASLYEQFRKSAHPELVEPNISHFYPNSCFVDLKAIGKWIQKSSGELSETHIPPIPKNISNMLDELFQEYQYIPNFQRFLLFYPTYFEKHQQVTKNLFQKQKIDHKVAYFLAICAAAELGCVYMMARNIKKFKKEGGNLEWLTQGKFPSKYKPLLKFNRTMARCMWEITSNTVSSFIENNQWTQPQFMLCIQILAFSQQNSTLALAMGLVTEERPQELQFLNMDKMLDMTKAYQQKYNNLQKSKDKLATLIPYLKQFEAGNEEQIKEFKEEIIVSKKMLKRSMRATEQESQTYMKEIGVELNSQELYFSLNKCLVSFLPQYSLIERRSEKLYPVIDSSDYSFIHAYPILNSFTPETSSKIKDLISYCDQMTKETYTFYYPNYSFGSEKVASTKEFRKAMRYYSENLCGYTHLEYDFKANMTAFLTIAFKFYIRLLTLSPLHINRQVHNEINHESGQSGCLDLGHTALLVASIICVYG